MPILRTEEETRVREWFGELARPVELLVALGPEETPRPAPATSTSVRRWCGCAKGSRSSATA